jgi:DNA-nicking Smr family endonuclease
MKSSNSVLASSDDETSLFRDAVRDVEPLIVPDKAAHSHKLPRPIIKHTLRDKLSTPDDSFSDHVLPGMEAGDEWSFLRPGLSRQTLRRLRRGYWKIDARLDLHGFSRDDARQELGAFLNTCNKRGFRCVQVIHGKGLNSKNREPVLKILVRSWLAQHNHVLAFCQANPAEGGSGAVLVLLKTSMSKRAK